MTKMIGKYNPTPNKKTTIGRQKIIIEELTNKTTKQVTFTKRRCGLFKKASELCILCDVEMAIIVFSPNNKPFTFGHPDVDVVLDRYLTTEEYYNPSSSSRSSCSYEKEAETCFEKANKEYEYMVNVLKEEKEKAEFMKEGEKENRSGGFWWDKCIDGLGLEELQDYLASMQDLKKNLRNRVQQFTGTAVDPTKDSTDLYYQGV